MAPTYHLHTVNRTLWCNTICHRFTPSFVRQIVAVKCSQTSGGISSPGSKLNNNTPCLPYLGPEHTHTHAHNDQDILHFPPIMLDPRGRGCSVGLVPDCSVTKHSMGKGRSRKLWCFSCTVFIETSRKNTVGPKVAVKTNTLSLEKVSL